MAIDCATSPTAAPYRRSSMVRLRPTRPTFLPLRLAAVAAVLGLAAGCSQTQPNPPSSTPLETPAASLQPPEASDTPTQPAPIEAPCPHEPKVSSAIQEAFGSEDVIAGYCTFAQLQLTTAFVDSYLRATDDDLKVSDFATWAPYMTAPTRRGWKRTVAQALRGDERAKQDVWSLMFYDAVSGSDLRLPAGEAATVNLAVSAPDLSVDTVNGVNRLVVAFNIGADLQVANASGRSALRLVRIDKRIVMALVRSSAPDSAHWLLDSWTGNFTIGEPREP